MQAKSEHPLFLDCLVPLLKRLAEVKYSVFAQGTHCQWHARTLACLAASMSHFLDPDSVASEFISQVHANPIALDSSQASNVNTLLCIEHSVSCDLMIRASCIWIAGQHVTCLALCRYRPF